MGESRARSWASVTRLAAELKVSRATVDTRIQRLLGRGVLLGFSARVSGDEDEDVVRAVMLIRVGGRASRQVIGALRGLPEIRRIHTTNGRWDLVAEIVAATLGDFDRVLAQVREVRGVAGAETSLLLATVR